jgi:pimeloyl-ACP methyl ester carboxylesterase
MRRIRRRDEPALVPRIVIPNWFGFAAGLLGTVLGIAASLYSSAFRSAIASSGRAVGPTAFSLLVAVIVSSGVTAMAYRWLVHRRQIISQILPGEIPIGPDVLAVVADEQDLVVGRVLHYLEAKRDSEELLIFLHGLGLDADDFRPYMAESRYHCVAITLYGFNAEEKFDDHYKPISMVTHVQLVAYAIAKLAGLHPGKKIALVGFSFGADVLLFLPRFAESFVRDLPINRTLLLDPNVNRTTTTISSRIAIIDSERPLAQLVRLLESADDVGEFRNLCEYVYKITAKNFGQIKRHAKEMIEMWDTEAYELFLDRLGQLRKLTERVHVVLSFDYDRHFNAIARGADTRGLDSSDLECSRVGHFDLIGPKFLKERLEGIV